MSLRRPPPSRSNCAFCWGDLRRDPRVGRALPRLQRRPRSRQCTDQGPAVGGLCHPPLIDTRELWLEEKQQPDYDPAKPITRPLYPERTDTPASGPLEGRGAASRPSGAPRGGAVRSGADRGKRAIAVRKAKGDLDVPLRILSMSTRRLNALVPHPAGPADPFERGNCLLPSTSCCRAPLVAVQSPATDRSTARGWPSPMSHWPRP